MNSAKRNILRKRAHSLKPVVMVGKQGVDERVVKASFEALLAHELIKVKFQDFHDEEDELALSLAQSTASELVAVIGHIAILFKQHDDPKKQLIHLPKHLK